MAPVDSIAGNVNDVSTPPRSRAADVLRRFETEFESEAELDSHGGAAPPPATTVPRWAGPWHSRIPRWLTVVAAVVGVAIMVAAFTVARRPPTIEDRLPMASEGTPSAAAAAASGAPAESAGSVAASGVAPASSVPAEVEVVVHVVGAVARPGVVRLPAAARAVDAVEAAGGLLPSADPTRVNLAAVLVDGQRVAVPATGEELPPEPVGAPPPPIAGGASLTGPAGAVASIVDLNSATAEQLDTLPGIGPSTAAAIVDHRESNGPFASVDALIDVRGIGEAKLEGLRDLVTVSGGS